MIDKYAMYNVDTLSTNTKPFVNKKVKFKIFPILIMCLETTEPIVSGSTSPILNQET